MRANASARRAPLPRAPKAAHGFLDVIRGSVERDGEQQFLCLRTRHPSDRAHLRVRQLAASHRCRYARQGFERPRNAHFLARSAHVDAALPVQPVCAGLCCRIRPAVTPIELRDEDQKAVISRVQMPRELGDLRFEGGRRLSELGFHVRHHFAKRCAALS